MGAKWEKWGNFASKLKKMEQWIDGRVVTGLQNGRQWGFPTANVALDRPDSALENGVYAVRVRLDGITLPAMMYVGTRPTLNLAEPTIEIHIFDFNDNIYGKEISFQVVEKVRDEQRFDSVDALIAQLHADAAAIREILRNY